MSQSTNLTSLFGSAVDSGTLTQAALNALNINDIGATIQAGLGVQVDDVTTSEVTLVTMLDDDSRSIRTAGNSQIVRDGHNMVIDALKGSKQANGILMHARYLNGQVLFPYCLIKDAIRMDAHNYNPMGSTPLYDQTAVILATVVAKTQEFEDNNVPVRSVTLILTDGADEHSRTHTPRTLKPLITDLLKTEMHIIAGMGIWDGEKDANDKPIPGTGTDFRQVFSDMGIPEEWILTPGNSEKEIRAAFQLFSQSVVRASQDGASFSQAAMGGFGAAAAATP